MQLSSLRHFKVSQWQAVMLFAAILIGLNLLLAWTGTGYTLTLAKLILINVFLAVSLTAANGFTGLFSLGHPAFMTLGAYSAVMFTYPVGRRGFAMPALPEFLAKVELPLWAAALVAAGFAGVVAFLVGLVVLRLKTHYLAVASLGLIIVVQNLALNFDGLTRGGRGLTGIPREASLPLISVILFLVVVMFWKIKHASLGRAMLAVRGNEMAARSYGIRAYRLKLLGFVLGAGVAGIAGALVPHVIAVMTPGSFGLILAFNLVAIIVVGGQGSIIGAILVALGLGTATEFLRPLEEATGLYGAIQVVVALMLIVMLVLRPKGLFGLEEPMVRIKD